jgi:hypothetical protein
MKKQFLLSLFLIFSFNVKAATILVKSLHRVYNNDLCQPKKYLSYAVYRFQKRTFYATGQF